MKKRLLALALCLVMMVSLLPLTAAADTLAIDSIALTATSLDLDSREANGLTAVFTHGGQGDPSLECILEHGLYYDANGLLHWGCSIFPKDWEFDTSETPECTFHVPGYTSELNQPTYVPG